MAFITPFILRQMQMAAVLGPDFWARDLMYSAAIKVSVLSKLVAVPSTDELDAIYRAAGVFERRPRRLIRSRPSWSSWRICSHINSCHHTVCSASC